MDKHELTDIFRRSDIVYHTKAGLE